ncbi:MAG: hypothetical protein J6Z16_05005 [Candidatus Methanomethylophilaceae archaeon]|nr:hypothetical protein [Candidatus Methanomethylophilaceae archaeon]
MNRITPAIAVAVVFLLLATPFLTATDAATGTEGGVLAGDYRITTDTSLDSLTVGDGARVFVTHGATLEIGMLSIATNGGTATFSTQDGAKVVVGKLTVEGVNVPCPEVLFSTPSASISAKSYEADDKKTLDAKVLFDDRISVTLGNDTTIYSAEDSDGEISVKGSLDLKEYKKRIAEIEKNAKPNLRTLIAYINALSLPKIDVDLRINASYGNAERETPFLVKDLHIVLDSHSRDREVYYSALLTLGEVLVYPVANKNMSIYIELPNSTVDGVKDRTRDEVRWFILSADNIHVDESNPLTDDSLYVDVRDLDIRMHSGDFSSVGISIEGLDVDERRQAGSTVTRETTSLSKISMSAFGTIAKVFINIWKLPQLAETIIGCGITLDSILYEKHQNAVGSPDELQTLVERAEVEGLLFDASLGYPESHLKLDLESFEYENRKGKDVSYSDVSYDYSIDIPKLFHRDDASQDPVIPDAPAENPSVEEPDADDAPAGIGKAALAPAIGVAVLVLILTLVVTRICRP